MNKNKKSKLIFKYTEEMAVLLRKLESDIGENFSSCTLYHGDIVVDGKETGGTKLMLNTHEEDMDNGEIIECSLTPQEIVQEFHTTEAKIKILMSRCLGLDHITDKFLEILVFEKKEARKALGEENKDYIKLL